MFEEVFSVPSSFVPSVFFCTICTIIICRFQYHFTTVFCSPKFFYTCSIFTRISCTVICLYPFKSVLIHWERNDLLTVAGWARAPDDGGGSRRQKTFQSQGNPERVHQKEEAISGLKRRGRLSGTVVLLLLEQCCYRLNCKWIVVVFLKYQVTFHGEYIYRYMSSMSLFFSGDLKPYMVKKFCLPMH